MNNFRSAIIDDSSLLPDGNGSLRTPFAGNVRSLQTTAPPLPQTLGYSSNTYGNSNSYLGNSLGMGYSGGYGGYGGYSGGYDGYGGGYGSYGGSFGYGGFGGSGGYNRFGFGGNSMNPMDPESRFIQMAESSSRPAFESIGSLVSAFSNIASMLDSTFFALTSSFHAVLGVAANFGRLRGVFSQFWQTFAIFRSLNWIYRKILYWLRISNLDPSSEAFKKAFSEAVTETSKQSGAPQLPRKGQSPWPVLAFLSFIFTAPYLIMKLLGTVTNSAQEEARNPAKWVQPIISAALYDFQARNASELSMRAGQQITIAPREVQNTLGLLNTGWGLATIDGQSAGVVPINYLKSPKQMNQERQEQLKQTEAMLEPETQSLRDLSIDQLNLSPAAFPAAPIPAQVTDFDKAAQSKSVGGGGSPPTIEDVAFDTSFS